MREILFRAKSHYLNEWLYGVVVHDDEWFISVGPLDAKNHIHCQRVKEDTIGQFTGLLDKNGKKIFEGDIFVSDYFEDGTKFVVVFEHGAFCGKSERTGIFPLGFANDSDETGCEDDDFYYPDDYSTHINVVGNIHDNPELLEAR